MSVIRCLAGVLSGNDDLASCEKQFIAVKEVFFLLRFNETKKKASLLHASSIHPALLNAGGNSCIFVQTPI